MNVLGFSQRQNFRNGEYLPDSVSEEHPVFYNELVLQYYIFKQKINYVSGRNCNTNERRTD
jgi:hypothetical protein